MATREQVYNALVKLNPNYGKVDMNTALRAAGNMNPAWKDAVADTETSTAPEVVISSAQPVKGVPIQPTEIPESGLPTPMDILRKPGVLPTLGAVGATALFPPSGAVTLPPLLYTAGLMAAGGSLGELGRQSLKGKVEPAEVGKTGAEFGAAELGLGLTFKGANYAWQAIKESPRIANAFSKVVSALTKQEVKAPTVSRLLQRAKEVSPKMAEVAEATKDRIYNVSKELSDWGATELKTTVDKGMKVFENTQQGMKNLRTVLGKQIEYVDNTLIRRAEGKAIDLTAEHQALSDYIVSIKDNPILKDLVNLDKAQILLSNLEKNKILSIPEAIKTKKLISDIYLDFSQKGAMNVKEFDVVDKAFHPLRKAISEKLKTVADEVGYPQYSKIYKKFSDFADLYDTKAMPLFGSKEGAGAYKKYIGLNRDLANDNYTLELINDLKTSLPKTGLTQPIIKNLGDLRDYSLLSSMYKDFAGAPSSWWVGVLRLAVSPTIESAVKIYGREVVKEPVKKAIIPSALTGFGIEQIKEK